MVNHYLRDVDHGSHCLVSHRTTCFTYMFDQTSEVAEVRGYIWCLMWHTERQRIRMTTKFGGCSAGHSERAICSTVTRATEFILLQTSHNSLTITTKTLCLSIVGEKHTVASRQHMMDLDRNDSSYPIQYLLLFTFLPSMLRCSRLDVPFFEKTGT
jgi:hypothetical protein